MYMLPLNLASVIVSTFGLESLNKVCKIENKLLKNGNITLYSNVRTAKYISKICLGYVIAQCQVE